jgi:hypothetical protein
MRSFEMSQKQLVWRQHGYFGVNFNRLDIVRYPEARIGGFCVDIGDCCPVQLAADGPGPVPNCIVLYWSASSFATTPKTG